MHVLLKTLALAMLLYSVEAQAATPCAPEFWGDGKHDDTDAMIALSTGSPVRDMTGKIQYRNGRSFINSAHIILTRTIYIYINTQLNVLSSKIDVKHDEKPAIFITDEPAPENLKGCAHTS